MNQPAEDARAAASAVARTTYGRLLAIVAARTRDLTAAEDALAEAFAKALETWPRTGPPDNPDAWLVVTARRLAGHAERHAQVHLNAEATIDMLHKEWTGTPSSQFPDERLKLLFVCAHPAIAETVRTPLMLQTVFGLDAARIGRAFLVPGPTMGQRLVRAKTKIMAAGIPFSVPEPTELPDRLEDVLTAIYAAFNVGWDDLPGMGDGEDFTDEALYLAKLVVDLMPEHAEALGLLSLMLYCEARRPARRTAQGEFVPLSQQDASLWNANMIEHAENYLSQAAGMGTPGRFQTEAAIQSLHAGRIWDRPVSGEALTRLYDILAAQTASIGAAVSRAAAYFGTDRADMALAILNDQPATRAETYQPYWVVRANALAALGQKQAAADAMERAIRLTPDQAVARHLLAEHRLFLTN